MKIIVSAIVLSVAGLIVYAYMVDRSLRRAAVINSMSELRASKEHWEKHGTLINFGRSFRVYPFTNHVNVDGKSYQGDVAVSADHIQKTGFMLLATDGSMLWIDRDRPPCVTRSPDGEISMPERFR